MKRRPAKDALPDTFEIVRLVGLALQGVEATTKYDGSPVLKLGGSLMAGLATHPSAEPDTLVVRSGYEERERLIEEAPETYYLTGYYRSYPLILVRLSRVEREALRDLLYVSWRMTSAKARSSFRQFEASSHKTAPKDLPSSFVQHRSRGVLDTIPSSNRTSGFPGIQLS